MTYGSFFNLSFLYQFQGPRNEEALEIFDKKTEINFETVHNIGKYRLHERFAVFSVSIGEFHVKNFSFFCKLDSKKQNCRESNFKIRLQGNHGGYSCMYTVQNVFYIYD